MAKFAAGVVDTSGKFASGEVDHGGKFASGGKFAARVILTPVAN